MENIFRQTVKEEKDVVLRKYYVIRGILEDSHGRKTCVKEEIFSSKPTKNEIAQFLIDNKGCTFCSVQENYRIIEVYEELAWQGIK
jgi:hypothetical protein